MKTLSKRVRQDHYFERIGSMIGDGRDTVEWKDFTTEFTGTEYEPKNWLDVRSVLQWYISNGIIKRSYEDLNKEIYDVIVKIVEA